MAVRQVESGVVDQFNRLKYHGTRIVADSHGSPALASRPRNVMRLFAGRSATGRAAGAHGRLICMIRMIGDDPRLVRQICRRLPRPLA